MSFPEQPNPARGRHGMATAPNALAAQSALAVLREGGNAVEAMISAAAAIAVVFDATKYLPNEDPQNEIGFAVYSFAYVMGKIIEACGDNLTRENLLHQATHLQNVPAPSLLPATTYNTSPDNYVPFKRLQLQRFTGNDWEPLGAITVD